MCREQEGLLTVLYHISWHWIAAECFNRRNFSFICDGEPSIFSFPTNHLSEFLRWHVQNSLTSSYITLNAGSQNPSLWSFYKKTLGLAQQEWAIPVSSNETNLAKHQFWPFWLRALKNCSCLILSWSLQIL